jgi:DNA polymerase-4
MSKIIVHIDLNAFFATCEQLVDPSLLNKPMAVGGLGRRGIILAASYEARPFGVRAAIPTYQALELCPQLIIKSPHFDLYKKYSNQFRTFISKYSSIIEVASIDECFIDMSEPLKEITDVEAYFKSLQDSLMLETGLKCSIGIGPTKFLAKMGSDYRKPMGITIIRKRDISKILFPLPIKDLFGVGRKTYPKLMQLGINTIGDFFHTPSHILEPILGRFYHVLHDWLIGKGDDEVITTPSDPKSIGNSSTFMNDTNDFEEIKAMFISLTNEVSRRATEDRMLAHGLQITIRDAMFKTITRSIQIDHYFNDYETILSQALYMFEQNYRGQMIRLIGIQIHDLKPMDEAVEQLSIFNYEEAIEENRTRLLINELNRKMKKHKLMRASDLLVEDKHGH